MRNLCCKKLLEHCLDYYTNSTEDSVKCPFSILVYRAAKSLCSVMQIFKWNNLKRGPFSLRNANQIFAFIYGNWILDFFGSEKKIFFSLVNSSVLYFSIRIVWIFPFHFYHVNIYFFRVSYDSYYEFYWAFNTVIRICAPGF